MKIKSITLFAMLAWASVCAMAQNNVAEEVAWVVGDQPIWKSEIEEAYQAMLSERVPIDGDPYCVVPEQLAIEKLYLHQADLDTIDVPDNQVMAEVDRRINMFITQLGTREKMEQYFRKSQAEIRQQLIESTRNRYRVGRVQSELTSDLKITPSDVRRYFDQLPADSIPFVPLMVEVQILTINPVIQRQEIEDVKARLRDMADRVNNGESDFSTFAILYSEDPGSSSRGGEIGFMGRGHLDPNYAAVAFNLNDPKKASKVVESEYGFHIIQLIEKRGDRINTRHILLNPKVSDNDLMQAMERLDSVRADMLDRKYFTFEQAVQLISQDKDTRNNRGVMVNEETGATRFQMAQLPQEIGKVVDTMSVGEVSKPFIMRDPKHNREIVAMVKLTNRIDGHKANLSDDYQEIKGMYERSAQEKVLREWLEKKIRETYVRIEDGWRNCDFTHKGWIKEKSSVE